VFRNHTAGIIDVKENLEDLTELVEIPDDPDRAFMLHPGEFVLGSTAERIKLPDGPGGAPGRQVEPGPARAC
jgi:dCTP deaminase